MQIAIPIFPKITALDAIQKFPEASLPLKIGEPEVLGVLDEDTGEKTMIYVKRSEFYYAASLRGFD